MKRSYAYAFSFYLKNSLTSQLTRSLLALYLISYSAPQTSVYQQQPHQTEPLQRVTLWQGINYVGNRLNRLVKAAILPSLLYSCNLVEPTAAQPYTYKLLGGPKEEFAFSMAPKEDDHFYMTGKTNSYSDSEQLYDLFLTDLAPDLSPVSVTIFKNITTSRIPARVSTIFPLSIGDFILASETDHRNLFPSYNLLVMRLNSSGGIVWSNIYGDDYNEIFPFSSQPGIESSDGHIVLTGGIDGPSAPNGGDTFVMKLNVSDGAIIWEKRLGGTKVEYGTTITENAEGDLFIASLTTTFSPFNVPDFIISKLTPNGSLIFSKAFFGQALDFVSAMVPADDGTVFICGETRHNDTDGSNDAFVGRLSQEGELLWIKEFQFSSSGGADAETMIMASDGNLIVSGEVDWNNAFVAKVSQNGTELWIKTTNTLFLIFGNILARAILELSNHTLVVAGHGDYTDTPFSDETSYSFLWSVPLDGVSEFCAESSSVPFVDISSSISSLDIGNNITLSVDEKMNQTKVLLTTEQVTFEEILFCPTPSPTSYPTKQPTMLPSQNPTNTPSHQPTMQPSQTPTLQPSQDPTNTPTLTSLGRKKRKKYSTAEKYFEFKDKGSSTLTYLTILFGLSLTGMLTFFFWQRHNDRLNKFIMEVREDIKSSDKEHSLDDLFEAQA